MKSMINNQTMIKYVIRISRSSNKKKKVLTYLFHDASFSFRECNLSFDFIMNKFDIDFLPTRSGNCGFCYARF